MVSKAARQRIRVSSAGVRGECFRLLPPLAILALLPCVSCAADLDSVVAPEVKAYYRAWVRREVRPDEVQAATREYIAYLTRQGKAPAEIEEHARTQVAPTAKLLRERDGAPIAFTVRRHTLEFFYFDPVLKQTNPTEFRLLIEPDSPRILDPKNKHLMTQGDVVALANLIVFAGSQGDPHRTASSRQQIDQLAAAVERSFGPRNNFFMPRYYFEASALWAGILREWPTLAPGEKSQVRNYAAKGIMAPMDDKLYGRLLDLSPGDAYLHRTDDMNSALIRARFTNDMIRTFGMYVFGSRP